MNYLRFLLSYTDNTVNPAGGSHELHPGGSGQPGIVVHVCETANPIKNAPRIQHTRCPEHS